MNDRTPKSDKPSISGVFRVYGLSTPLVGRDGQIHRLNELFSDCVEEMKVGAVMIMGNQGVGKSRLVAEWVAGQRARRPKLRVLEARAQQGDGQHGMWARLLRNRFELAEHEENEAIQQRLREEVTKVFEERRMTEILHFLGSFLNVRFPDNPFLRALEGDQAQHERIARTVLRRFVETDAAEGPMLILFEDLQWADTHSLELLAEVAASTKRAPLMLVGLGRPALLGNWPREADEEALKGWTQLELGPLERGHAEEMLKGLLAKVDKLPDHFLEDAVEMTGGNPYFLEQLIRLLITQGVIETEDEKWSMDAQRFEEVELPMSVEEAVQARISALTNVERTLLQMASVLGNVFWFGSLVALSRLEAGPRGSDQVWRTDELTHELQQTIESLVDRDYLMKMPDSWVPADVEFVFKHNLEFAAISSSTDPARLKRWHLVAAQWLETRLGQRGEDELETLAQHYETGGNQRRAAYCYVRAGDMARARFANEQAIAYYKSGMNLLRPDDALSKIDALHNLGDVCALVGKSDEALIHFEDMLQYAYLLNNVNKGGAALGRIGRIHRTVGNYDQAEEYYKTAQRLFLTANDRRGVAATLDDLGKVMWLKGDYDEALKLHRQALQIRKELGDERSMAFTLGNIGIVHQDTGHFRQALEFFQKSMEIRERIGDRQGMVHAATYVGSVWQDLGETDRAAQIWREALKEARTLGDRLQQAYILANLGDVQREAGQREPARKDLEAAVEIAEALGDRRLLSECYRKLGELAADEEDWDTASRQQRKALELAESSAAKAQTGAAQRSLAALAYKRKFFAEAETRFQKAMEIFSSLGHHMEVARSCEAMAAYHEDMGEMDKAAKLKQSARDIRAKLQGAARQQNPADKG